MWCSAAPGSQHHAGTPCRGTCRALPQHTNTEAPGATTPLINHPSIQADPIRWLQRVCAAEGGMQAGSGVCAALSPARLEAAAAASAESDARVKRGQRLKGDGWMRPRPPSTIENLLSSVSASKRETRAHQRPSPWSCPVFLVSCARIPVAGRQPVQSANGMEAWRNLASFVVIWKKRRARNAAANREPIGLWRCNGLIAAAAALTARACGWAEINLSGVGSQDSVGCLLDARTMLMNPAKSRTRQATAPASVCARGNWLLICTRCSPMIEFDSAS